MLIYKLNQTTIMMKIILSLFLFLTLVSSSIKSVFALCNPTNGSTCVGQDCKLNGVDYCCVDAFECAQLNTNPTSVTITNTSGTCGDKFIDTAIGCIPISDTNTFIAWVLDWAIGVGGGIAFFLIVYASFMVMTSRGDPDRLKSGHELLTSAISGLIMLIFSVLILDFIGFDILGLDIL